jgi:hypothetical protein
MSPEEAARVRYLSRLTPRQLEAQISDLTEFLRLQVEYIASQEWAHDAFVQAALAPPKVQSALYYDYDSAETWTDRSVFELPKMLLMSQINEHLGTVEAHKGWIGELLKTVTAYQATLANVTNQILVDWQTRSLAEPMAAKAEAAAKHPRLIAVRDRADVAKDHIRSVFERLSSQWWTLRAQAKIALDQAAEGDFPIQLTIPDPQQ